MDAEENRREDYDVLIERDLPVCALHIRSLSDVNSSMEDLATRVGVTWRVIELKSGADSTARVCSHLATPVDRAWVARRTGAHCSRTSVSESPRWPGPYPTIELETVRERHPDVVLAPSEPYPFSVRQSPELELVAPTYFVDGKDLFWWGHRTHHALARFAVEIERICAARS